MRIASVGPISTLFLVSAVHSPAKFRPKIAQVVGRVLINTRPLQRRSLAISNAIKWFDGRNRNQTSGTTRLRRGSAIIHNPDSPSAFINKTLFQLIRLSPPPPLSCRCVPRSSKFGACKHGATNLNARRPRGVLTALGRASRFT